MARAREARVSMMRLTQSIWMGLSGDYLSTAAPANARIRAQQFTVSWNCRNLRIESKMLRPHRTAFTMELKLSSRRMMAAASLATSVPAIPMAKPTSAFFNAGASLVPSPVTATTSPTYRVSVRVDPGGIRTYEVPATGELQVGDQVRIENNVIYRL